MKHRAQLITTGGYGIVPKPIAYDLAKGSLFKSARVSNAVRYGKRASEDNDERPVSIGFRQYPHDQASLMADWKTNLEANAGAGNSSLSDWTNPLLPGGSQRTRYLDFNCTDSDIFATFTTKSAIIAPNSPWGINIYIEEQSGDLKNRGDKPVVWLEWGEAGQGYMFQIIDNSPAIAQKSSDWNEEEAALLRSYQSRREDSFIPFYEQQIAPLTKKLYVDYQSLSLENTTGKGEWTGQAFTLTFVPEPRGAVHILTGAGGDAQRYDVSRILKTEKAGEVWGASTLRVGSFAAPVSWQVQKVVYLTEATIEYGPLPKTGEGPVDVVCTLGADQSGGTVTFAPFYSDAENDQPGDLLFGRGADAFGLRLTLTSGNGGTTSPWVYRASARTLPGERVTSSTESFNSESEADPSPVLDVTVETEATGRRHAKVIFRDVKGRSTAGAGTPRNTSIHAIRDRMAALNAISTLSSGVVYDSGPLFTQALVTGGRTTNAAHYAFERGGIPQQLPIDISKGETRVEVDLSDGWAILDETPCSPPPILDGLTTGAGLDAVLQLAGMELTEGVAAGVKLPVPALGGAFALVPDGDSTCGDVLRSLMERFGLGYRFYQDGAGLWRFVVLSTTPKFAFVSDFTINSPETVQGRNCILDPLDWQADNRDFHNYFEVIGGTDEAPIRANWIIQESITNENFPSWIGRLKPYPTLRDESLNNSHLVQLALRSMVQRYGKAGRYAQFTTYCRFDLYPGDRGTIDGLPCEIESIQGCSIAADEMQIVVREVI